MVEDVKASLGSVGLCLSFLPVCLLLLVSQHHPCELWPHHRCLLHLPTMHAAQCVHNAHTAADCGTHACDSAALALGTVTWEVVCRLFLCFLPFTLSNRCQMVLFFSLSDQNPSCSGQQFLPVSPQSQLLLPEAPGTLWASGPFLDCFPPKCLTWLFYLTQTFPQMSPMTLANSITLFAPSLLTLFPPCSYLTYFTSLIKKERLNNLICVYLSTWYVYHALCL